MKAVYEMRYVRDTWWIVLTEPFSGSVAKNFKLIRIMMVIVVKMHFIGEKEYSFY
jgi:hypothetical protein